MNNKKSPLKGKPLRQAGQSVQEQLNDLIDDKLMTYSIVMLFVMLLTMLEWYRWYVDVPPSPLAATVCAVIVVIIFLPKTIKSIKQIKALRLGRDGEKVVGEYLEHLRMDGCIVFHDIVGDKFNVDHVVLSQKGIYVVETKTYSKPNGREPKVRYDGIHVNIDSIGNKDEILIQVEAESSWLKQTLRESTGRDFDIKPVVVFPGWYVESKIHNKHWVLNPKGLPKFIQAQKDVLSQEDVKLAAYHLSMYIRSL